MTLRYNTERPETVTAGGNILVGSDKENILKNAKKILNDEKFAEKMKNAKNPYGEGNAASKMLDSIEKHYNNNELALIAPDEVMTTFKREIKLNTEDITVSEFEEKYNTLIPKYQKQVDNACLEFADNAVGSSSWRSDM